MSQYDKGNIFAKMLRGEIPCNKVYEDEYALAFHDLHPQAPIHILVIPKGEYISFDDFVRKETPEAIQKFFQAVQKIAADHHLVESGYRLIANHGNDSAQTVKHFHVHLLGKKFLGPLVMGDTYHARVGGND